MGTDSLSTSFTRTYKLSEELAVYMFDCIQPESVSTSCLCPFLRLRKGHFVKRIVRKTDLQHPWSPGK